MIGERIAIECLSTKGLARATATLLQLWGKVGSELDAMLIEDAPAVPYRSFMIDLGRNPHSLSALLETVDLLWFYKVDSLHLHLIDDQRFAFPSTAYPKLTRGKGQLSLADFRHLERYAKARGVTLIPELETPGHSTLLRKHYPKVLGKSTTETAHLKSARVGLKTLLDEMMDVFASPYVHIGGDEAYGVPQGIQRDLVNDLAAHVIARGRKAMVWEGPALGVGKNKIRQDVIHINWRTVDFPADEMVDAAWDPLYLVDHYPRNTFTVASPEHIYTTLQRFRFRHFNPGMKTFADPVHVPATDRVIGYCMPWWEGREDNYLSLVVPRLIPMAAVAWSEPKTRDYSAFARAVVATEGRRREAFYPVATAGVFHRQALATLHRRGRQAHVIRYTLDGSEPSASSWRYAEPIPLNHSVTLRARAFACDRPIGHGTRTRFVFVDPIEHLALGKPATANVSSGPLFCVACLTDGGIGNLDYFLGYPAIPKPIELTVDLEREQPVELVRVHTYTSGRSFESYEVLVSVDGERFERVADRRAKPELIEGSTEHRFRSRPVRYVRVRSHGHKSQVFDSFSRITEIEVR